jgi:uncharacterized membrane protein
MNIAVIAAVLFAAILHATWNALIRSGSDRHASMTYMMLGIVMLTAPAAFFAGIPNAASLPYIVASALIHIAYNLGLIAAYRHGDLSSAYPISRGSSPLLVMLGAAVFAQEQMSVLSVVGVIAVSAGIMSLALEQRRLQNRSFLPALFTGVTIALYTVVDGLGVRASESSTTYTVWIFLSWSTLWCLIYLRRTLATPSAAPRLRQFAFSTMGGLVSIGAYGIVIWALQFDAMGVVSALRETSVLFAALIGRVFLGEMLTKTRIASSVIIAAGVILLVL